MEGQIKELVDKIWTKFQTLPPNERLLIAISGIPGSGKTTLAHLLTTNLNALHPSPTPIATTIPMDGYHLTRSQLSALPNAPEAIFRRGAAFTFDSASYLSLIRSLRLPLTPSSERTIYAPSFSHALKDPVENDIAILSSSRILVIEGLYLSLSSSSSGSTSSDGGSFKPDPPQAEDWVKAGDLMDMHVFVEVGFERAAERLVKRHVESGICESVEVARERAWESDLRNGREIVEGRRKFREGVDVVVKSWEDEGWR
ncbi:phosphoribulokinase/uridine kinase [Mollisia scopiformis]|uniref:Phosphoribulokinase/uridine kinase n=1 Tax=Mollisia scopiformis TaxID=149040 RepID=A0A194WVK1_MOLSC|nr:phosphoribulokinase/uridine kinase [Mollisia scopiformis]KUJ11998.1 phosphoribulokinase/uridine kinase [Mollisia scopiformis]